MPFSISMIWPTPPRMRPAPPESGRYSLRQTISVDIDSKISIDPPRTPLGKPVADSPSRNGNAPIPPVVITCT